MLVLALVLALVSGRAMRRTAINRQILLAVALAMLSQMAISLAGWAMGMVVLEVQILTILLWTVIAAMVVIAVDRRVYPSVLGLPLSGPMAQPMPRSRQLGRAPRPRSARTWLWLASAALAACSGEPETQPPAAEPDPMALADGVHIDAVSITQGVEIELLAETGEASAPVPLLAGRDALLRVFVSFDAHYDGSPVTARLTLGDTPLLAAGAPVLAKSSKQSLSSTLNLDIEAALLTGSTSLRVELLQPRPRSRSRGRTCLPCRCRCG